MDFYSRTEKEVLLGLNTSTAGLASKEAAQRLKKYGPNELKEKKKISAFSIFLGQFKSFIVYILIAAVILSILLQEYIDAAVIAAILVINAILGFTQEYKAEKSLEALKKLVSLKAKVIRDGKEAMILASELVPGDIIILDEGAKVPADSRLLESYSLSANESTLTGESVPVKKLIDIINKKAQVADQKNMVFSGTSIISGIGKAVVAATGENTEIGKIATLIQETEKGSTPLQKQLKTLSKQLGIGTIIICIVTFILLYVKGSLLFESLIVGIALAVAAIPEGLPAIVTMGLALGSQRMIKHNVLIRKLPSVETLGSTTVICADKTGTLTLNKMTVTKLYINGAAISAENKLKKDKATELLFNIGVLCNNAKLDHKTSFGDPTEIALLEIAANYGMKKEELQNKYQKVHEIPFSSERKMMSTINKHGNKKFMFTKGAPDVILKYCTRLYLNGRITPLTGKIKNDILKANEEFAKSALRVLGFAYKEASNSSENNLIFVGLQGMIDPPRKEVKKSIAECKKAGIKVVMITGDHKLTAEAIATDIGIVGKTMTGDEIDSAKDLSSVIESVSIYARVNPLHKLKIVEALKKRGHVVAMTGDGVNDAPALKKADIGIATGTGTDVTKEASDMVLLDDNFTSIVNAVREGRGIYSNIVKFVMFLLSSNIAEVLIIFFSILIGLPLPLLALQILWINLVTDGLPALALSIDPIEKGIMQKKPRKKSDKIVSRQRIMMLLFIAAIITSGTLFLYKAELSNGYVYATTAAFTAVVLYELVNVLNFRSETGSVINSAIFTNKYLVLAIILSLLMQLFVVYGPIDRIFKTTPLALNTILLTAATALSVLLGAELLKFALRKYNATR